MSTPSTGQVRATRLGLLNENLSGHATFHRHLVDALRGADDFDIKVIDAPPRSLVRRYTTNPLPLPQGWDFDLPLFRNQIGQSLATRREFKPLAEWADVLHMYTQNVSPLNVDLIKSKPLVVTSDGTCLQTSERFPFRYPGRGAWAGRLLSRTVERRLLKKASVIIAQSDWARQSFIDDVGINSQRVKVVRLGAPPRPPVVNRSDDGVRRVLYIGASMTRKGGHALVRALADDLGPSFELHLVTREPVQPQPHVVVHDSIRPGDGQIDRLLALCDIFTLPSDMDMSPNAVLEAMSYGLPVVAYRSGGIPEMVEHGHSGYLAEVGDIGQVRSDILKLAGDASLRESMGHRGAEIHRQKFDPDTAAAEFLSVIRSVSGA